MQSSFLIRLGLLQVIDCDGDFAGANFELIQLVETGDLCKGLFEPSLIELMQQESPSIRPRGSIS